MLNGNQIRPWPLLRYGSRIWLTKWYLMVNLTSLLEHVWIMTSSNRNIFRATGPLWGECSGHQWIYLTKTSDAELWCFLPSAPEQTDDQTYETLAIWAAIQIQIQIQNRFIVRCTKYTIQKHINIQGKTFWNIILRIWYTDMTYDRHWMWGKLLLFRKRYLRCNGLRRDLHTRNQHCHDTKCRPFNARRTKTY